VSKYAESQTGLRNTHLSEMYCADSVKSTYSLHLQWQTALHIIWDSNSGFPVADLTGFPTDWITLIILDNNE